MNTAVAGCAPSAESVPVRRARIRILSACDNVCVFCGQHGLPERTPSRDEIATMLRAARARSSEVTLVGGEPTLHPELARIVEQARALGFVRVGIQTNARHPDTLRALAGAGLTDLHLSIHGGTPAAHDYHTGVAGSFASALAMLAEARAVGVPVGVATVLTRSNARGLGELATLLATRGAAAWCITIPRVRGRAAEVFDRVVPRLGIAMPFALHAMQLASTLGLPAFVRGAPTCLLGPFARHALFDVGNDEMRAYGDECAGCAARPTCPGVEPWYLARFAGDELSAVAPIPPVVSEVARMFVGEGELAEAATSPLEMAHVAPAKARVALPMLGKVQPALAEVPKAIEKKTGAALREIFKDLFVEEEAKGAD